MVDYIVEEYGRDKLLGYMKNLITSTDHVRVFKAVFEIDFQTFVREFKESVKNHDY